MATKNASGGSATKSAWFDEEANAPIIAEEAQRLESFVQAMADGKVTDDEVKAQEARVMKLMKEIEPQLDPKLRDRVTELLCELTAYDMMQALNMLGQSRPATTFRG
jgi:hypothetical protein